jgi:hypothetical protein
MAKNKAAAALGRKGGKAGRGASKRRSPEVYGPNLAARWSDNKKRRRSCVVCGRRVLATSREFDAVGRTCEEHRKE